MEFLDSTLKLASPVWAGEVDIAGRKLPYLQRKVHCDVLGGYWCFALFLILHTDSGVEFGPSHTLVNGLNAVNAKQKPGVEGAPPRFFHRNGHHSVRKACPSIILQHAETLYPGNTQRCIRRPYGYAAVHHRSMRNNRISLIRADYAKGWDAVPPAPATVVITVSRKTLHQKLTDRSVHIARQIFLVNNNKARVAIIGAHIRRTLCKSHQEPYGQ